MVALPVALSRARAAAPAVCSHVRRIVWGAPNAPAATHGAPAQRAELAVRPRFAFALSVPLRRDPASYALQVPRVPPRKDWPALAEHPTTTHWRDLWPAPRDEPTALQALGSLQHWVRTAAVGGGEEAEASAYWAVCRAQARQEAAVLAKLRRGEGTAPVATMAAATAKQTAPHPARRPAGAHLLPAWLQAAEGLAARGLLAPTLAARARDAAAHCGGDDAAASAEEGVWGALLVDGVLRSRCFGPRGARALGRGTAKLAGEVAASAPPAEVYAQCLATLLRAAEQAPEPLLPAPGTRRRLTVALAAAAANADAAGDGARATSIAPAKVPYGAWRWSLTLTSAVPNEPGPPATWRLGDADA